MSPPTLCGLIPGPTTMPPEVLAAHAEALGSPDTDPAFWDDYLALEHALQALLCTRNDIAIQSGEGMVALWGALRSTLRPGDRVVCAVNGVFGEGFAAMARAMHAEVVVIEGDWRRPLDTAAVVGAIREHAPRLVTVVHCETPSGLVNSLADIGAAVAEHTTDGLLLVDFVSSAGAVPLDVDASGIDLGLLAPQKVLSGPAALAMTTVSDRAWRRIRDVGYVGYDALLPFAGLGAQPPGQRLLPYTHNWHAIRATLAACRRLLDAPGGLEASHRRHADVAAYCRELVTRDLGLELYCEDEAARAPTVTAVCLPAGVSWATVDAHLRAEGVALGGSYGPLAGRVVRFGHMGTQADRELVARGVAALGRALAAVPATPSASS